MTRDPRSTAYDDATIEQLVRDAAEEWTMPPVRLDEPAWRDRVRRGRARRIEALGGWVGRLGQAATAAVALTVVAALVAVMLTRPQTEPGKSPPPSSGTEPSGSPKVQATALPKLFVSGDEPNPSVLMVRTERGDFARVDLTTGTINGPLTGRSSSSEIRLEDGGSILCLCVAESGSIGGQPTDSTVTLDRYDARGKLSSSTPIEQFSGEPDPRDESVFIPDRPAHVLTSITFSDDGRYGFVGWSVRAHPVWQSGIVVVALSTGTIASRLSLPDENDGADNTRRVVGAPTVVGSIGAGSTLIARGWYEFSPAVSQEAFYTFENDVFRAGFAAGTFGDLTPVPNANDCGDKVIRAGALSGDGFWLACTSGGVRQTIVRRLAADGTLLGDARVVGREGIDTDPTAISADGTYLYVWDPSTATLTRVEVATGDESTGMAVGAVRDGPLSAFGRWLAPTVVAKSFLRGALAISPDGTRVYAIGVKEGATSHDTAGSSGVFVFDAATMEPLDAWKPTADYVSLAVSPDGKLVYAAGLPGVDATGQSLGSQQASITVFDTSDGSIRLIAGRLGVDYLTFVSTPLR